MKTVARTDLEELLSIGPGEPLFLSVFLSTSIEEKNKRETDIFLKKKIRQFEKYYAGQAGRLAEFRRNVERLRRFLDEELDPKTRGVAVFLSVEREAFRAFQLSVRLPNRFVAGNAPEIGPLAEIVENHTHHCIVLLDQKHGRILSVFLWKVVEERELREEVPAKVKVGGWSQMRFQRHHQDKVTQFLKDLAVALEEFFEKESPDDLVVLGQDRNVAAFVELLPAHLRSKVVLTDQVDLNLASQDVVRQLRPILESEVKKSVQGLLDRLEDQIRHDHLAVGGLEETLACLQEGRVDTLVLNRRQNRHGLRCKGCGYLFATNDKSQCDYCGALLEGIDLINTMVEMAERHRMPVEFIQPLDGDFMSYMDGVGAFLKY